MLLLSAPVLANDNEEARIKAAVEDRYKEWIAAANKKDVSAMTSLYDENAVLMPKSEEPVIGKAAAMFRGDVTRNGEQIHFYGKNLLVWKQQADGSWKIFRYMFDEIPEKK
jgi:ketosteroid isomerase-like protein